MPNSLMPVAIEILKDLIAVFSVEMITLNKMFETEIVTAQDADKIRMIIQGMELVRERMCKSKSLLPETSASQSLHDYYREKIEDADNILGRCRVALDTWELKQIQTVGTFKNGL